MLSFAAFVVVEVIRSSKHLNAQVTCLDVFKKPIGPSIRIAPVWIEENNIRHCYCFGQTRDRRPDGSESNLNMLSPFKALSAIAVNENGYGDSRGKDMMNVGLILTRESIVQ